MIKISAAEMQWLSVNHVFDIVIPVKSKALFTNFCCCLNRHTALKVKK